MSSILYGDYIRHVDSIWIGSLIKLLARFGMSPQSACSTVLRMSRGGSHASLGGL